MNAGDDPLTIYRHEAQSVLTVLQTMSWLQGWDESYKMGYVEWQCPSCGCHGQKHGEHHADACKLMAATQAMIDLMAMPNIYNPQGRGVQYP
jgi:hypothetical protein